MKKIFYILMSFGILAALVLTACGGGSSTTANAPSAPQNPQATAGIGPQ